MDQIVREIANKMGSILAVRIHVGIADSQGNLLHIDSELEQFKDFIQNFVQNNFGYLQAGDHSLPISGKNIMFFRLPKAMIIIYSARGRVGQLLSFKSLLPKYTNSFDPFISNVVSSAPVREHVQPELETIPSVPVEIIEKIVLSRESLYFSEIFPKLSKKIKGSAKFSLNTSVILNYSDGVTSVLDLYDRLEISKDEFLTVFYKLNKSGWIKVPDYELFQVDCPTCKSFYHKFIPMELLKSSPKGFVRFQFASSLCDHTCYVIIDKKGKIKTKVIPRIEDIGDEVDLSKLSIKKLIQFFGQDIFFSLFHSIFFKHSVLFLESEANAEKISNFMVNFFPQVVYGDQIRSMLREEYLKLSKKYADFLVIDLNSNIVVNEPYETEDFDFELELFRKILREKDEKIQILKTHAEFERLILNIDTILNEIERFKEIKEDELIDLMKKEHNLVLERSEIPIIKELADIYYDVDIRKKITKTLVGQVSDWLSGI